jgi:hypothetical protein
MMFLLVDLAARMGGLDTTSRQNRDLDSPGKFVSEGRAAAV